MSATIPADCEPLFDQLFDHHAVVEITDGPDRFGKHQWCFYYRRDGVTKAQMFRADLREFLRNQRVHREVRVVDRINTGKEW